MTDEQQRAVDLVRWLFSRAGAEFPQPDEWLLERLDILMWMTEVVSFEIKDYEEAALYYYLFANVDYLFFLENGKLFVGKGDKRLEAKRYLERIRAADFN